METPWLILCRVVNVAPPGAHADAEEDAALGEAEEDEQAQQEEHASVREAEEHVAAVDAAAEAQEREGYAAFVEEGDAQAQHATAGEAEEDPQAQLEESVVNMNTDAAASEAAHCAAEPDFIISVAPPLEVSSLIAGLSSHPDPERPDMYPYIIASGRFCLLTHFAVEPFYGTNFSEDPNPNHSHLIVVRHFHRAANGQITACAARVPDRPKNMLKLSNVESVGLVCNNQTGDYEIAELAIPSGCLPFFIRFSSEHGVWKRYRLPSPLDADDDRREWVPHGTIAINSTVFWFDLSWGMISCDLAQPPGLPMLDFHRLPHGRLLPAGATPDIHSRRCIAVSENLLRYVEIIVNTHEGAKVSMWYQDVKQKPWRWIANYEERLEDIWKNNSYIQTKLPRKPPMLVGVCPVNYNVVYFTLNQHLFGVNVPDHKVVNCERYEPLKRPGLPDEPITSRYLITWSLDTKGAAINAGHQPDTSSSPRRGTQAPSPSSSPLRSHATVPLPSVSASTSTSKETPYFDIFLDDIANSLSKALEGIKEFFKSISNNDLAQGKIVTKKWGCFLIRIFSSRNSIENPIYALYRTHDLYLDSVLSNKIWYRLKDHQAMLPSEVEYDGSVTLDFKSDYGSLNCNPDQENQIVVCLAEVLVHVETLQQLALNCNSCIEKIQKAFVMLILFMEALRFPEFEKWLLIWISKEEGEYIPLEHTILFRKWRKLSIVFHAGRHEFNKAPEIVKKYCQTYDNVCAFLGIVNQINLRKLTKATKSRKKKKTRWDAEEADSGSENKRGKKKRH